MAAAQRLQLNTAATAALLIIARRKQIMRRGEGRVAALPLGRAGDTRSITRAITRTGQMDGGGPERVTCTVTPSTQIAPLVTLTLV